MHEFLTDDEIGNFFYQLIGFIKNRQIDMIVTIAKKGTFLFNYMLKSRLPVVDEFNSLDIPVFSDREINKMDNYDNFHNKNVLLFDDSLKTGSHFIHTTNYLKRKINKNLIVDNEDFNFFYYAYIKCQHTVLNKDFDITKLGVYLPSSSIEDYFEFCHNESIFFQKNLIPTSTDLPILRTVIDDINKLLEIFNRQVDFIQQTTTFNIANESFDLSALIIDDSELKQIVGEFLISATCKIRYEYNDDKNKYDVLFSPFAICDSIKYEDLEVLYNILFDEDLQIETKAEMNLVFVKLYRYVIYLLSYIIGDIIKKRLQQYNIDILFDDSFNDQFYHNERDELLMKKAIDNYEKHGINIFHDDKFTYTCKDNIKSSKIYSFEQIKIFLYDMVVRKKDVFLDNKNDDENSFNYSFTELHPLVRIYNNTSNCINLVVALFIFLESFVLSNEIEFDFKNGWIQRGLSSGESSISTLPINDHIFYCGLTYYYDKVNKNYELYKKNYSLFIDKFNTFLKNEGFFDANDITLSQFKYLSEYFEDVNKDNLSFVIESKKYILQSELGNNRYRYIINWLVSLLESVDFTFNGKN